LHLMCVRAQQRTAFGKKLSEMDTIIQDIARSRSDIEQARMLVLGAADEMDRKGNKEARKLLSLVKAAIPEIVQRIADRAIQIHGAAGVSQDTPLIQIWAGARALRLADGPDEVHWRTAGRLELKHQEHSSLPGMYHKAGLFRPGADNAWRVADELEELGYSRL